MKRLLISLISATALMCLAQERGGEPAPSRLAGYMEPGTEASGVRAPYYDEQGNLQAQLYGEHAKGMGGGMAEITNLRIDVYRDGQVAMTIFAPKCFSHMDESRETPGKKEPFDLLPDEVLAANFWLLAAPEGSPDENRAWFKADGQVLPVVGALRQWVAGVQEGGKANPSAGKYTPPAGQARPIAHYLLLPTYEWGVSDWHLDVIRPFVKAHRPTVGFSLVEAAQATHVTVVGGPQSFPEEVLDDLRAAGCSVERIQGDGTSIASQLESR